MHTAKGLIAGAAIILLQTVSFAGEVDILINKLAEKGVITYGEAQTLMTEAREDARKQLAAGKVSTLPAWIQNISMKGDLRLRHQVDWSGSTNYSRDRERLRLRVGFDTRIVENVKAAFGIATGGEKISDKTVTGTAPAGGGAITAGTVKGDSIIDSEPTSTNHTFGNGFSKPMLMVDFAYMEYSPYSWVKLTAGKMKSGAHVWKTTDLLWDTDINPDGAAVTLERSFGMANVFLNGSWLIFNELNSTSENPDAYIAQPGVSLAYDKYTAKIAVAFENLNVNGKSTGYYGTPTFDYKCTNPSFELTAAEIAGPWSLGIFGDMVSNGDSKATSDKDGSAYGARFGAAKVGKFGDWQVAYIQRKLGTNSWLSKLGDSDAYGGALNSTGNEVIVTVGLTKSLTLGLDYYSMDLINGAAATTPKSLVQVDAVYKF